MKKIILIAAMFLTVNTYAAPNNGNFKSVIQKVMTYSQKALDKKIEGVVYVSFKFTEDQQLEIIEMNASHDELADMVAEKLGKMDHEDFVANKVHNCRFDFKIK